MVNTFWMHNIAVFNSRSNNNEKNNILIICKNANNFFQRHGMQFFLSNFNDSYKQVGVLETVSISFIKKNRA